MVYIIKAIFTAGGAWIWLFCGCLAALTGRFDIMPETEQKVNIRKQEKEIDKIRKLPESIKRKNGSAKDGSQIDAFIYGNGRVALCEEGKRAFTKVKPADYGGEGE